MPVASNCAWPTAPPTRICCRLGCWRPAWTASRNVAIPDKRLDINMYTEGHTVTDARRLPLNLLDALRAFEASTVLREALGDAFTDAYVKLRQQDWDAYARHLTQWERDTTLDV